VAILSEEYHSKVEELAERLGPRIEAGELRAWRSGDGDRFLARSGRGSPPSSRLRTVCQRVLARTLQDAFLVLAVTAQREDVEGYDVVEALSAYEARYAAAGFAAQDVLAAAQRRGSKRARRAA
jgi:hypothetical protein